MFLNIGENIYIPKRDIIVILNAKKLVLGENNRYIKKMLESSELVNKEAKDIKSYIITCDNKINRNGKTSRKKYKIYISNISSTTLLKRFKDLETRLEV